MKQEGVRPGGADGRGGMSHRQFVIKMNRRPRDSACAVCGKTSELDVGPVLFTSTGGHVCPDCGRKAAPELAALLALAMAAEHYIAVIFESADHPDPEDSE